MLRTLDDRPAWHPEQRVTVAEALRGEHVRAGLARRATRTGAGASSPGMVADLVVLDRDPLAVEPEELGSLRVLRTMVGGVWTYDP